MSISLTKLFDCPFDYFKLGNYWVFLVADAVNDFNAQPKPSLLKEMVAIDCMLVFRLNDFGGWHFPFASVILSVMMVLPQTNMRAHFTYK